MIIVAQPQASLPTLTIPAAKSICSPQILQLPLRLIFRLLRDIRIMQRPDNAGILAQFPTTYGTCLIFTENLRLQPSGNVCRILPTKLFLFFHSPLKIGCSHILMLVEDLLRVLLGFIGDARVVGGTETFGQHCDRYAMSVLACLGSNSRLVAAHLVGGEVGHIETFCVLSNMKMRNV